MTGTATTEDRCRGVLIGLAAGDRIGGPIRMAVRLGESLLDRGDSDRADVLNRYLAWWRELVWMYLENLRLLAKPKGNRS